MKKTIITILILILNITAFPAELTDIIANITSNVPSSTKFSIYIYNISKNKPEYSKEPTLLLKPASTTKLYTSAVALRMLGKNFPVAIKAYTNDSKLKDKAINGNIYLKGYGNTLMTGKDLELMAKKISNLGIKRITGNVMGDDSFFDSVYARKDWIEEEYSSTPVPPISAIVLDKNMITVNVEPGRKKGSPASVNFKYKGKAIRVINQVVTAKATKIGISQSFDGHYNIIVSGTVARKSRGTSSSVFVKFPAIYAAAVFRNYLESTGITVNEKVSQALTPQNVYLLDSRSVPLGDILSIMNKRSDNFLAESIFKLNGAHHSHVQGNAFYSTQAVLGFLSERKIFCEGTELCDGSGLSHYNRTSTKSIVELLKYMYLQKDIFKDYYESLSIASEDGTLRNRMWGSNAEKNLHGKTGTLNGVSALAGYLKNKKNEDVAFAIIWEFNQNDAHYYKSLENRIVEGIAEN